MSPRRVWAGLFTAGLLYEVHALKRHNGTLSATTRYCFRTGTTQGKTVFTVTWTVFALWFWWHIVDGVSREPA